MFYYCPLESYKERYTMQWSAPITGWIERRLRAWNVEYIRVEGDESIQDRSEIKIGSVVDGVGRSIFAMSQVTELLLEAEKGHITSEDIIYFDDFWHPGMEALRYAFDLMNIRPKMFAFLHAQSVDEFDFTFPMRGWMRHFEKGNAAILDGIFVCGPCLRDLVEQGGIADSSKIHVTGHPIAVDEVEERMEDVRFKGMRSNEVIYSSRFDREKNPHFFMDVAEYMLDGGKDVKFVVCSGAKNIRSTDPSAIARLRDLACYYGSSKFEVAEGLTKEEYYARLCRAKVQFNTADQDFVAITLLEASVAGCYPVYPYFRSFPETFEYLSDYMYRRLDLDDACRQISWVLGRSDLWTTEAINERSWIHNRFDTSFRRMLDYMQKGQTNETFPYIKTR